jgi:hypothetical protein
MEKINRRAFLNSAGSAIALTIVPSFVLGGNKHVPPSDKINLGLIGVGTQQLGELVRLITDPRIQVVSVCDPNKNPVGYMQWGTGNGLKTSIRELTGESNWGGSINVPSGRDSGQDFINKYYAKNRNSGNYNGCSAFSDYREMLAQSTDMDAVKIIVPDHAYPKLIIDSLKNNKHVIVHKPLGNRVHETRAVINAARQHPDLVTHMLAWSSPERYAVVKKWIDDGVIGTLKEIHNWSYRPVWQQWQAYFDERPGVPEGFDWDLWLGAWPGRPYHPHYTHTVYRGWYDFGAGSIADMGIYSLWPLFSTFGIDAPPYSVEANGTVTRTIGKENESKIVQNDVAFPLSSVIRWKFNATKGTGPFDLFWYDGGMKPHNPPEMEADNKNLESEGMMFVGDKGKILGGFRCENPVIIPESRMIAVSGSKEIAKERLQQVNATDTWIESVLNNKQSPGNLPDAATVIETAHLAAVALRAGSKILYDPANMKITNNDGANKYLYRPEYRPGWEV